MGRKVFANGMEIAHKAGMAKVIAAFPDVCLTPPGPPAGPIPVPYPNTSFAKDLKQGTKKVSIGRKPASLQNMSHYASPVIGDEAATKSFGGSVITFTITGKTHFQAFSMDVMMEGKPVDRHLDITTSNHMAMMPGSTPPMVSTETMSIGGGGGGGKEDEPKCDCCGKAAHSEAQANGEEISENDFYSPKPAKGEKPHFSIEAEAFLKEVRAGPCKNLLPPAKPSKKTKCNKYYVTTPAEKRRIESQWDDYKPKYYRKFKVPRSTPVGHRVPKSGGGCPTGPGNLTPVPPGCDDTETKLSQLQQKAITYHRKRR